MRSSIPYAALFILASPQLACSGGAGSTTLEEGKSPVVVDEPVRAPIAPATPGASPDLRSAYLGWLRASRTVALVVEIEKLTRVDGGEMASVRVLRSSRSGVTRKELLFPTAVECAGVERVHTGETLLVHVPAEQLADPNAKVVSIGTAIASPMVLRAKRRGDGRHELSFPWGSETFESLTEELQ